MLIFKKKNAYVTVFINVYYPFKLLLETEYTNSVHFLSINSFVITKNKFPIFLVNLKTENKTATVFQ